MDASRAEGCSSSSIPISPQWVYDVFVSFRGADTQKKFTSHLFAALEDNGFLTFRDDTEPERGEFISNGLLKAIEGSRMSLIVFSKDYAGSRWCLDELVRIMDCRETLKQIVIPIFYDVVPSDVRKQTGVLQDAFAKHKKHLREESDGTVENWRAALSEAANLSGRHLQNEANGDEAELIKMIIEDVRKVNPTHLNVPDSQVGLDRHVAKLNRLLNMEFNRVGIVAIWGMGGIGKTTIAKSLYNLIQHEFEHSCFLANVRETWQRPNGLDELQKKLLLSVLKRPHEVSYFHEGFEDIKRKAIGRKKVLLVLDDVDNDQQLKALAIDRDSFGPGSRIIITTRNKSSLKILKLDENEIYGPEKLDKDESLELFSWHTFKYDHPPEDHLDLSRQIVNYAGGLPLALEVLGSYFRGKSIPQWERAIAKLRKIPTDDVLGKLKISYDSLNEQLKMLFLDMACFFVGIGRDFTIKILKGRYDIFVDDEIQKLADRCLIKYDYHDQIVMHDMIRDMGRELIVGQESLDPGKRSRLWYRDDVLNVLRDGTGTEAVNGLLLNATDVQVNAKLFEKMDKLWQCEDVLEVRRDGMGTEVVECRHQNFIDPKYVQVNAKAFERMNNLWLLHLDYVHLTTGYEHISRRLLWLRWKGFPLDCIPRNFFMQELVALDLRYSSLEKVWNRNMILDKLKFLYLSHCHYLTRTPNFSRLSSLEELLLNDCKSLVEVDKSIRCLNKLLVLDMKNCTKLQKLPSSIWMLKSLESLDLSGCSKLGNLGVFKGPIYKLWCSFFSSWTFTPKGVDSIGLSHTPVQANSCLTKLNLENCHLSYLSEEIGNLISLRTLNLAGNNLSTLPDTIGKLSCLKDLSVDNNKLSHLPSEIGDLDSLETLDLRGNEGLNALPESICKLVHLRSLNLQDCNNLCHLPSEIDGMISLNHLDLGFCNLSHLPCGIGGLTSLEHLYISGSNICTIPDSISSLHRLGSLSLNNCAKLRSLPKLPTRTSVFARHCPSLESLPLELDQLGRCVDYSESNKLAENSYLTSLLKQLPRSKGLSELQHAVNILVPVAGDEEVRIWFPYHEGFPYHDGRGPNVSFVVPRSPSPSINQKMVGWILLLYGRFYGLYIRDVIFNKIEKKGFFNSDFKVDHATHGDHVWLLYIPQGYEGLQLEGGDEVEIPIYARAHEVVKNWAIDVIYGADDELHKGNDTLYQVVGPI